MPVSSGIVPSGAALNQLTALTRRAFIPKMVVQIYNASPTIAAMFADVHTASGGVSSITVPVQGNPMVQTQWTDYSGSFNQPPDLQGAYPAEFNLKAIVTPVPFLGFEGAVQMDHAVVPILEARMNDATNSATDALSQALFNNFSNTSQLVGLPGAIDDGTNLTTYGNINRTANPWWQGKVYAAGSVAPTRQKVFQYIVGTAKNGAEMPTFGVMGPGTFASLSNDFIGVVGSAGGEIYNVSPGVGFDSDAGRPRSAFRALDVAGVPIYVDVYCPEGTLYLINTNYLNLYVHEAAAFAFTGFESLLSNYQIGYIGAVVTLCEMVLTKPKTCSRVGGFTFLTI
jgi:hypothetical protein